MGYIKEVNTDRIKQPEVEGDLFLNRATVAGMQGSDAEVSIIIVANNRLEKTRRCVESVLKYTKDVDYELILIDSGSQEKILDYYETVEYSRKKIIHITKNLGAAYAYSTIPVYELGKFVCIVQNDLIVTSHWLKNLLICMKSDMKIGMVNPVTSNVSNMQCVSFPYENYDEMQRKAEQFNHSDPRAWEERLRLVTLGTLYRKDVFMASGWPMGDMGFFHDFFDDDISFCIRRLGYRTILAGDTWICHDHDILNLEGKDQKEYQQSLINGKTNFRSKYYGLDAEDAINYYIPYINKVPIVDKNKDVQILGIDVRCGAPVLDVKNRLRKVGILDAQLSAFTCDPQYWLDLKSICEGEVHCDRIEFISDVFPADYFDYIVIDRPFNCYDMPQRILKKIFGLCKSGGVVICKLKNTGSFQEYVYLLGQTDVYDKEFSYHIPLEAAERLLEEFGIIKNITAVPFSVGVDQQHGLIDLIPAVFPLELKRKLAEKMMDREYLLMVQKR